MRRLLALASAIALISFGSVAIAQSSASPKNKYLAGRWTVSAKYLISSIPQDLVIRVDGDKVSGTAGPFKIHGTVGSGKFSFSEDGEANIAFSGTIQDDGSLAGTASLIATYIEGKPMRKVTSFTATRPATKSR
ncbi:MAG: hypothetical protein ABI051_13435 [Vicinamibacterales bacterium]